MGTPSLCIREYTPPIYPYTGDDAWPCRLRPRACISFKTNPFTLATQLLSQKPEKPASWRDARRSGEPQAQRPKEACVNRFRIYSLIRLGIPGILSAALGFLIAGCGSNTQVGTIQITPATQSLAAGQTAQFTATGIIGHGKHPASNEDVTTTVSWTSNAPAVATVSATGLATGVSAGTATITASMPGGISATAAVTVTGGGSVSGNSDIVKLDVIPGSQSVASPTQTSQFIAIGTNTSGGTIDLTQQATWSSSAVQIATIGANSGLATGVGQGSSTITALFTNPDKTVVTGSAAFQVIGGATEQVTALAIYPNAQSTTALDQQTQFFVLGTAGSSGLQFDVTGKVAWTSSNTQVVTIGTNGNGTPGLATSVGSGSSTITATYTNADSSKIVTTATYTATIGAAQEDLLSIQVVPGDTTVSNKGMTEQFLAFGTYSKTPTVRDITNSVTWVSTSLEVASIDSCGAPSSGPGLGVCPGGGTGPVGPSGGLPGEYAGLTTAQGYEGVSVIYAVDNTSNSDGTVVLSNPVTFTCQVPNSNPPVCDQSVPTPQFATLTVYIAGEQTAPSGEYVTAPSGTGTPNLIHCGREYSGAGGQVCTGTYAVGSTVKVTENLAAGSTYFGGWSTGSACAEAGNPPNLTTLATTQTCTVTLNGNATVGVIFY